MRRPLIAILLAILAPAAAAETLHHVILRDGEPVGSYRLSFERNGDTLVVDSDLTVDVRAGFLPLFVYRHTAREVWQGDSLTALQTETYDNGRRLRVSGHATSGGFVVDGAAGRILAPADIRPASFWRPDMVAQSRLLDPETGRVLSVGATLLGEERGDGANPLRRYRLSGQLKHEVELSYSGDRWLSARFRMLGSDIEFRAQSPAEPPQVATVR